ncbi:hypothetical protein LOR03_13485 [Staphylococcus aureus]|uniref:hypothetical protein n=1 Tax=Staphylococcus aureus TaxID=1280 RepID=UPI0020C0B6E1|nr:hypothetical protein [Staphylococcus aureus]
MVIDENKKQLTSTDFEFKKDKINQEFLNVKNKNFWQDGWSQLRKLICQFKCNSSSHKTS